MYVYIYIYIYVYICIYISQPNSSDGGFPALPLASTRPAKLLLTWHNYKANKRIFFPNCCFFGPNLNILR